jgi:tetratricopeptide (TPR) repeat protein
VAVEVAVMAERVSVMASVVLSMFLMTVALDGRAQDPTGRPESRNKAKKPASKRPEPLTVILTILTEPPGSQILINGEDRGVSSGEGKITIDKIPLGHYDVEVRKEGFTAVKRGFEAGRDSPTMVFKLIVDLDSAAKDFDSLVKAGKLTGPEVPNAFELVSRLSSSFPDRAEVGRMRLTLFEKLMDLAGTAAKNSLSGWRETPRDTIVHGRDAATAALALKGDDVRAQSQEALLKGLISLRDWLTSGGETRAKADPGPEDGQPQDQKSAPPGPDRARTLLQQAVNLDDSWALAKYQLGRALLIIGDAASAEPHLTRAVQLEPNWAISHIALGEAYYGIKKYKESISEYQKALSLDPNSAVALAGLGLARSAKGDTGPGTKDVQRAIEMDPARGLPHLYFGTILARSKKAKDWVQAEDELKVAMQKNQDNLEFQNGVAQALIVELQGRKKK